MDLVELVGLAVGVVACGANESTRSRGVDPAVTEARGVDAGFDKALFGSIGTSWPFASAMNICPGCGDGLGLAGLARFPSFRGGGMWSRRMKPGRD